MSDPLSPARLAEIRGWCRQLAYEADHNDDAHMTWKVVRDLLTEVTRLTAEVERLSAAPWIDEPADPAIYADIVRRIPDAQPTPDHIARPWVREHDRDLWHHSRFGGEMRCGVWIAGSPLVLSDVDVAGARKCDRCLGYADGAAALSTTFPRVGK